MAYVTVWADAVAADVYTTRAAPFPDGAVIVKQEHADDTCTDVIGWTAMRREAGFDPANGDWHWQNVELDRSVTEDGRVQRCQSCHAGCGIAPDGHDGTCSVVGEE